MPVGILDPGPSAAASFTVYFLLALGSRWVGERVLVPGGRAAIPQPWTERARLAAAAGSAAHASALGICVLVAVTAAWWAEPGGSLAQRTAHVAGTIGGVAGVVALHLRLMRWLRCSPRTVTTRVRAAAATATLFAEWPLLALAFVAAATLGEARVPVTAATALVAVGVGLTGGGVRLASALGFVRPASPELLDAMQRASAATGITARRVYEVPWRLANAFAFPAVGAVVVTDGALACLSPPELEAVCAHELGHLGEPASARVARVGRSLLAAALIGIGPVTGTLGAPGVLAVVVTAIVVRWGVVVLGRRMEARADRVARTACRDGRCYARALERLHQANLTPAVIRRRSRHPDLYDRMLAAGMAPEYPRPLPPAWGRAALSAVVTIALSGGGSLALVWVARLF